MQLETQQMPLMQGGKIRADRGTAGRQPEAEKKANPEICFQRPAHNFNGIRKRISDEEAPIQISKSPDSAIHLRCFSYPKVFSLLKSIL